MLTVAQFLQQSDERDRQLDLRLDAWRDGWRACQSALGDQYELGRLAGIGLLKRAQHEVVESLQLDLIRWDGLREDFGRPRPGDFGGGALPLEHAGMVWLGGQPVHWGGGCTASCRAYESGWYSPFEAIAIMRTLPHDYREEMARLSQMAELAA